MARALVSVLAFSAALNVGAVFGPISTEQPSPAGGTVTSSEPPTSFFQDFNPPYPTNDWWAGYAAGAGDAFVAGPFPYQSSLDTTGVNFGVSTNRNFDGTSVQQPTQTDWTAGFSELSGDDTNHKALAWDTQSVTLQHFTGSSTLTSYMVPGSPYMTFEYSGATPMFTSGQGDIISISGIEVPSGGSASASGEKITVVNDAGTYIIYSLSGSLEFSATSESLTATNPFNGVLRAVKLQDASHEALLDEHYGVYPTAVTTDYDFSGDSATLKFIWDTEGSGDLLMLTWPHHRIKLQSANFPDTSSLSYLTTKGYMYPVIGDTWNMQYDLPTITWNAPRDPDSSCTDSIIAGLEYEVANLPEVAAPGDFYWFGGHVGMVSRLALIADHLGRDDLVDQVLTYLKAMYAFWFDSSSSTLAAYEDAWGSIINKAGVDNVNVDYGNGFMNDHLFHYGYFLAAAAAIAKFDNAWLGEHKTAMDVFLRDIVNPSDEDPYFTTVRCRDWFAGHSWASGIANGAGARDQESIGEAVNGYYGALLWAEVTGNDDIVQLSRLLLATEQHAAQVYWHMYPDQSSTDRDQPYPEQELRELVTIGNVEDWQSGAWLFWGDVWEIQIPAIQILPVIPVNEYMYDEEWATAMFNRAADAIADPTSGDEWKSVVYLAYSAVDPADAAQRSTSLTTWGSGNSYSNQLYFIATRPGASGVCSSAAGNPTGSYALQSTTNDQFVSTGSLPDLMATGASQADAAIFEFGFAPNAGTIQAVDTDQYVTADSTGEYTISASRASASDWEIFIIRPKDGAASDVYTIQAASNKKYVVVGADGSLVNNGDAAADGTGFRFVAA